MPRPLQLILAISRGIAFDSVARRRAMTALLVAALILFAIGVFPLWSFFPEHPLFFAIYWLACAWLTFCSLLLAIYDLMMINRRGREERAAARQKIFDEKD